MTVISETDILLPENVDMRKWAVIACDQFTSRPDYWQRVSDYVGSAPSTLHMILPEANLKTAGNEAGDRIRKAMEETRSLLKTYPSSMVYTERTMEDGQIRRGLVCAVDLEAYDYTSGAASPVRATEMTVPERLPARQKVRMGASLELPHVILFCDDPEMQLIEAVSDMKENLQVLYDLDLMEGGGHITGRLVSHEQGAAFFKALSAYMKRIDKKCGREGLSPMYFAVGDGNHSLAAAKACYEALKAEGRTTERSRYALVELENIEDPVHVFQSIHRLVRAEDPMALLNDLKGRAGGGEGGYPVTWYCGEESGCIMLDQAKGDLAVEVLQDCLDAYAEKHPAEIDYIHGETELADLARAPGHIGFALQPMDKRQLFPYVIRHGSLPRKTFSMGHAREKRYYIEAKEI